MTPERNKELAELLPVHVMRLANTNMGLSLMDWNEISNDILDASRLLTDMQAELTWVTAERNRAQTACELMGGKIRRLEKALEPFSRMASYWLERDEIHGLNDDDECATEIRFGDLRAARAALKGAAS